MPFGRSRICKPEFAAEYQIFRFPQWGDFEELPTRRAKKQLKNTTGRHSSRWVLEILPPDRFQIQRFIQQNNKTDILAHELLLATVFPIGISRIRRGAVAGRDPYREDERAIPELLNALISTNDTMVAAMGGETLSIISPSYVRSENGGKGGIFRPNPDPFWADRRSPPRSRRDVTYRVPNHCRIYEIRDNVRDFGAALSG